MASSLTSLALRLHIRGEKHEDFRKLCAYHLRSAIPDGETINTAIVDTACTALLEEHDPVLWPMYQEARRHLLDSPGDTYWKKNNRNLASVITGPRFLTDSKPARKQDGPFARLSSRLGKIVKNYFEALAAEPALWSGDGGEDVEVLLNSVLAVTPKKVNPHDGLTEDIAAELWLRDAHALKSLAMHHLCKVVPEAVGRPLDGGELSDHESKIEEAVVSFMDTHGSAFWPLHREERKHLRRQVKRTRACSFSQGLYSTASAYWDMNQGPVLSIHGRMPKKTVARWKEKYRGNQPSERELVACSKIGQVLKTYFTELLRTGQGGEELDDLGLSEIEARLLVKDVEAPVKGCGSSPANLAPAAAIGTSDDGQTFRQALETDDSAIESRGYFGISSPSPPNYVPADQLSDPVASIPFTSDNEAFGQAFSPWRPEPATMEYDLFPSQSRITENSNFAARADSIFSSSFDHIGPFKCPIEGCYHHDFGCTTENELTLHYGLYHEGQGNSFAHV